MLEVLDHVGLFAFAISGVLTAANRNLDILGGYVIAFITALGGGTIRDLLLNVDVALMTSFSQVLVVIASATAGIVFRNQLKTWRRTLSIFDTVGISVFTIVGVQKGLSHDQLALTAVFLGLITATFGGLLRDRSEEHTSELQSRPHLVCRLLLEKKKKKKKKYKMKKK